MTPLTPGSVRAHLNRLGGGKALASGKPVLLSREFLVSHFPRGAEQHAGLPESYDAEWYTLTGDDDLRPAED